MKSIECVLLENGRSTLAGIFFLAVQVLFNATTDTLILTYTDTLTPTIEYILTIKRINGPLLFRNEISFKYYCSFRFSLFVNILFIPIFS